MANITSCTKCHCLYEAGSEEQANEPERFCGGTRCKNEPIRRAWVTGEDGKRHEIRLVRDRESFRWIQAADGADTEVSAGDFQAAVDAAVKAWGNRIWKLEMEVCPPSPMRGREVPADGLSQG